MAASIHCIVFARAPLPGRAKTRLAAFLGNERAASAYDVTLRAALRAASEFSFCVYCADAGDVEALREILHQEGLQARVEVQTEADLGLRMAGAFAEEAAVAETEFICLIGSDLPAISSTAIAAAAQALAVGMAAGTAMPAVVLGPAVDGGYWLIGAEVRTVLSRNVRDWFGGMEWSLPTVLESQKTKLAALFCQTVLAETLADIDTAPAFFEASKSNQNLRKCIPDIRVILPVLNEEANLPHVIGPLAKFGLFSEIICADNGSTDASAKVARELGALVIESERGYGNACLAGIRHIEEAGGCDAVLFIDADASDRPEDAWDVLAPVVSGRADFCLGRRIPEESGALLFHARFGNWLSCALMRLFWGGRYHDLGPLRAVGFSALQSLSMEDKNFGWTVEMQIRALKRHLKIIEIPVGYRKRMHGESKVSASIRGSVLAGFVILRTVFRELLRGDHDR